MAFKMDGAKKINMHPAPYKQEGSFTFDQDLFDNCEDNVNLYGYFQSEKYFKNAEKLVRLDFRFKEHIICLLYTSPSPRDEQSSRMPSSA